MDVIIPSRHPLVRRSRVKLDDLREEDWVFYPSANIAARSVAKIMDPLGFEPRVMFETNDFQVVRALVGLGQEFR
jgi:LysR family transcriptional activator of glutamate synthase operon